MLAAAGCFPPDLGEGRISCGAGGTCPPDYLCRADNRCYSPTFNFDAGGAGDLAAGGDLASDMTRASLCTAAMVRVCTDATHSAICMPKSGGFQAMPDRTCPTGSMCADGHCQPPAGASSCTHDGDCSGGQTCIEYVVAGALTGFCTTPGRVTGNPKCTNAGFSDRCGTGICAFAANDPSVRNCLDPCRSAADCNGKACDPVGMPMSIEGASTTQLRFCAP